MAGGKETPRQKMIGMMYLVLTALLALQVSNSVLEKFIFIDEALREAGNETRQKNSGIITSISTEVDKKGNRGDDKKVLDKAKQVNEMAKDLISYLDETRTTMAKITGGGDDDGYDDETGQLIGAQDIDIVANYMIDKDNGEILKKKLNDYAAKLGEITGKPIFEPLAKDAKDLEIAKHDENQRNKSFSEYYFGHTPTAAGMATMSHIRTQVLNYETKALSDLAEEVGAKDFEATDVFALVRPESNTVAAGAKFKADLFIAASSKSANPTFLLNGKELEAGTTEDGITYGKIEFTAKPGKYGPDLKSKETFEAKIQLADTAYTKSWEYYVIKPVVQVRSAALQALYMNCGNELDIQVPALGTEYNPSFASSQATVVKGNRTGLVTVIPKGRSKVKLSVMNSGNTLSVEEFDVKKVPAPSIDISSRGRTVDFEKGVPAASLTTLKVSAEAEENFAREVPKDSRYRVTRIEVKLARAGRQVKAETFTSENLDLRSWRSLFRKGDNLVVKIENVIRRTYQGENERVKPLTEIYSIPID